jgi:hypothetical protein
MTMTRRSARVTAVLVALSLAGLGCAGAEVAGEALAPPTAPAPAVPAPAPAPPTAPPPPPEPVIERRVSTLPDLDGDPEWPLVNTRFQRFDSLRHQEVGQTLEVTEAFELHRISVWFAAPSIALPGFRELYYDGIDWSRVERLVQNGIEVADVGVTLSIILYRSPDPEAFPTVRRVTDGFGGGTVRRERDVIVIDRLELVSDQRLIGTIRATNVPASPSHLDLTEPVVMEPGRWLVALRIDQDESDVDVLDLPFHGWESGRPPDVVIPSGYPPECNDYTPADDPTPGFGYYWRDGDRRELFIPGLAKVAACGVDGRYDNPMGTGDIALDLWGLPSR